MTNERQQEIAQFITTAPLDEALRGAISELRTSLNHICNAAAVIAVLNPERQDEVETLYGAVDRVSTIISLYMIGILYPRLQALTATENIQHNASEPPLQAGEICD